jgi:uncharacterized protein (TIGR02284 family)
MFRMCEGTGAFPMPTCWHLVSTPARFPDGCLADAYVDSLGDHRPCREARWYRGCCVSTTYRRGHSESHCTTVVMNLRSRNIAVDALNRLAELNCNAHVGYATAARSTRTPLLRAEFSQYAMQRQQFALQLRDAAQALGETISEVLVSDSRPQRAWCDIDSHASECDDARTLRACARAEISTLRVYDNTDMTHQPEWLRQVVLNQQSAIERVLDRLRSLEHSLVKLKPPITDRHLCNSSSRPE